MSYPVSDRLAWPVAPYEKSGYVFGERAPRRLFFAATHLGDDVGKAGAAVSAIGDGEVVWCEMRLGSDKKRNWGGIVVLAHQHKKVQNPKHKSQTFCSVYGHLRDLKVRVGERVAREQTLGVVAEGRTPENGWWEIPHLHFAICVGPWRGAVLPGFWRWWERRTRKKWWRSPKVFIEEYNRR